MAVPGRLMEELLALSPEQKAEVVDELLIHLCAKETEIDRLWKMEVERRLKEYKQGEVTTISMEELIEQFETKQL